MNNVTHHISKLIYNHNCVIVPGFGGFVANYQPAKVHPTSFIFNSPSKSLAFNVKLKHNDGLLVDAVSRGEGISHLDAERMIAAFVSQINTALIENKPVKLAGIGRLIMDVEHNIQFLGDNAQNFLMQSYGLYSFNAQPIVREQQTIEVKLSNPAITVGKTTKKRKSSDALLPIAAVLLLTMLTMQIFIQSSMNGFNYTEIFGMNKVFTKNNYLLEKYEPIKFVTNPSIIYFRSTDTASKIVNALLADSNTNAAVQQPILAVESYTYFISAGSFYSNEEAETMLINLKALGYEGFVKTWGKYKIAAVNIPDNISTSSFREIFIENTGVNDAWVARN